MSERDASGLVLLPGWDMQGDPEPTCRRCAMLAEMCACEEDTPMTWMCFNCCQDYHADCLVEAESEDVDTGWRGIVECSCPPCREQRDADEAAEMEQRGR